MRANALGRVVGVIAAAMVVAGCLGSVNSLKVGDCFVPPASVDATVEDAPTVPCTEPHGAEVVFVGDYAPATDTYPIEAAFRAFFESTCTSAFNAYTGLDFVSDPTYDMAAFTPTPEGWSDGDRKVICYAVRLDDGTMTQSIRKA